MEHFVCMGFNSFIQLGLNIIPAADLTLLSLTEVIGGIILGLAAMAWNK